MTPWTRNLFAITDSIIEYYTEAFSTIESINWDLAKDKPYKKVLVVTIEGKPTSTRIIPKELPLIFGIRVTKEDSRDNEPSEAPNGNITITYRIRSISKMSSDHQVVLMKMENTLSKIKTIQYFSGTEY